MSVYRKGDHQCVNDYRPVFLLPLFSKTVERIIHKAMFKHFLDNNLVSSNQSSFKPGGSCINQLIPITHDILKGFDDGLEVRGVVFDISKAIDKVWHEVLIYKLRNNGICGNSIQLLLSFLDSKKQRVLLNGQCSATTYKSFVRPHLHYGNVIFNKVYNNSFQQDFGSSRCYYQDYY